MAIALVATFYGLLVANLIVNPAGENIEKHTKEDEDRGVIAMQTILLAAERVNLLEAQEVLNSFVEERERVDVIGITTTKGEAA
jgi:chemotaxis protein MotA